jgi:hypothetical protein
MAKKRIDEEPAAAPEPTAPATEGPMDYRKAVNLTSRALIGLPLADGTTISMAPGPYSSDASHISRPFLNKWATPPLRRMEKEGKIRLEPTRGE